MSGGQMESHGRIENWQRVKALLFQEKLAGESNPEEDEGDWGDDWGWKDDEEPKQSGIENADNDNNWIRNCVMANSPMAELLVLARGKRAVFFSSEWDTKNNEMKYTKSYEGIVSQENEEVTCAACIPLVSQKKSSPGVPDWTCVILGFNDGQVKMYTENGSLLISQMFHNQPVKSIKCRSYQPASTAMKHDQLEEVFILYPAVLITMDGFGLFQTLRGCRSHIARLQANAAEQMIDPPPLSYKKWEYDASKVRDCDSIGLDTPPTFDHMLTASVIGGPKAKCSKLPITSNVFVTCGERPYAAFMYAQEGQSEPLISEFAFAVASRLKSSLFNMAGGMFGFGSTPAKASGQAKPKPKIEPAAPMQARFGFPDKQRKGQSITSSPCRKLSAITDSLGRVIIVDNDLGIAIRMFKGYRDAQCAWLEVNDDMRSRSKTSVPKKALFLVIYAPRRGFVEVFAMQQGPKVASFPVSKQGRLLSTTYGMMGLNNIPIKGGNQPVLSCAFVDHDAQIYSFNIPFHLALSDNGNNKIKDMHLLKSLQRLLREDNYDTKGIMDILTEVKTPSMINQGFKLLVQKCKQLDILTATVDEYLKKYCDDAERDLNVVFRIQTLLDLYTSLVKSIERPPSYSPPGGEDANPSHEQTILKCMHATEKEIKSLQEMAKRAGNSKQNSPQKSVSFKGAELPLSINEFFSCFNLEFDLSKSKCSTTTLGDGRIKINLKSENVSNLGKLLFCGCLNNDSNINEWKSRIKAADLIPSEVLTLCLKFWCQNALASSSYVDLMEKMYQVIRGLSDLEGKENVFSDHSRVSFWWEVIRKQITSCPQIFHIYSFSMVCRAVAVDVQQEFETEIAKKNSSDVKKKRGTSESTVNEDGALPSSSAKEEEGHSDEDDEEWENVSLELIRWNILVKQIEDLHLLTMVISQRPKLNHAVLPVLNVEVQELSVVDLLDKGKGCIAELVGKWLTSVGIEPKLLVDQSEVVTKEFVPEPEIGDKKGKKRNNSEETPPALSDDASVNQASEAAPYDTDIANVLDLIKVLRENFSVSLTSSIILSNYCWEYCLEWNKDPDNVECFSAAISCSSAVPCPFTKHGMMYMMWSTFIKKRLAAIVSVGRIAKEKLVEKVSGFSTAELKEKYLKSCVSFLDDYMITTVFCDGVGPPPTTPSKKSHWATDASSASLTDLALSQSHSNYEMILLHYQLALTAHLIYAFGIKKTTMKPMNLFDTKARMMFFSVMSSPAPYSNVEVDLALKVLREEFLCLCISNAIYNIPEELDDTQNTDDSMIVPSQEGVLECQNWIQKCFELARTWGLELDNLRINQVCEFYSSGLDYLGLENIGSVSARDVLGSKLLVIAGMRVNYIIQMNRDCVTEIISSLSTNLTNWLNNLNYSQLRCLRFSKVSVTELAQQIVQLIPESSYDYKLAEELLRSSHFFCS